MDTCPVSCIHWVSAPQLALLEDQMAKMERVGWGFGGCKDWLQLVTWFKLIGAESSNLWTARKRILQAQRFEHVAWLKGLPS
jgi:hypothetical protein